MKPTKYKSKKKVGNKWIYFYHEDKNKKPIKPRIDNYYSKGRHKYFNSEKEKKAFLKEDSKELAFKKEIKKTSGRLTKNTKVTFKIGKKDVVGRIVSSNGTKSKSPTHFNVEVDGKIKKDIPRVSLSRSEKAWSEEGYGTKHTEEKKKKQAEKKPTISEEKIQSQARNLVMKDWKLFSKMVGRYYDRRVKGGWDASKFGFDEADLKQEAYIVLQKSAESYLKNPKAMKDISFKNYAKSFMKSNLASKLAAGSGAGGHLKASAKDQLYLMFFQNTVDEYKKGHNNRMPPDDKLVSILNDAKDKLKHEKGNKTIKDYGWTLEKVQNKKRMSKKMVALDRAVKKGDPDSGVLLDILNDDDIDNFGKYYKIDPIEETNKIWIQNSVVDAIKRKLPSDKDRHILIRTYGLFVKPSSSQAMRNLAGGQSNQEIADALNKMERNTRSLRRWTGNKVDDRLKEILKKLRSDETFKKQVEAFVKSEAVPEWGDSITISYWMLMYKIASDSIDNFLKPKGTKPRFKNLVITK